MWVSFWLAGLAAAAPAAETSERAALPPALAAKGFALKLPQAETVMFRGMASFDNAGGHSGSMLYPGYAGLPGFFAAIATHGILVEASKNSEKARLQQAADKVLEPYKDLLVGFTHRELMQRGLAKLDVAMPKKLIDPADVADDWVVESTPVYTMTQDESALVLENIIAVYAAGTPVADRYQNVVKVVSDARAEAQPRAAWTAEQGRLLKDESVALYAHSLKLVLQDLGKQAGAQPEVHKTFRYAEGKAQKMERAQLLLETCDRAVIKTLRGWLMSIPLRPADGPPTDACKDADHYPA